MKFSFEDLDAWKVAFGLAHKIYLVSQKFPKNEMYGIVSQIRRASLSVCLNIAEGKGRHSNREFNRFLLIARGSLYETITLLKMCLKLGYIDKEEYSHFIVDCEVLQSKTGGLLNYLNGLPRRSL